MTLPAFLPPASADPALDAALLDLFRRGTPANTLRAYERDFAYLAAWKRVALGAPLVWPEDEGAALRFVADHARDLRAAPEDDPARGAAEALIAAGLRRSLACPAPATLDRRIASWRALHRMRGLASPFDAPLVRETRAKARRAAARPRRPKSAHPVTAVVLERLLGATGEGLAGLRDRALLETAWASGGRRRSEISAMDREDVDLERFDAAGLLRLRLRGTKTHGAGAAPALVLKGLSARRLVEWIEAAGIEDGPLFRPVTRARRSAEGIAGDGRALARRLSPDGVRAIFRRLLEGAGLPAGWASPHGLRSGFLTEAALQGVPLQAAMRLSLHRSHAQAARYYDDVDVAENPAADLRR